MAVLHVCFSDDEKLRQAMVGSKGKWIASKGLYDPRQHRDLGLGRGNVGAAVGKMGGKTRN